MDIIILFTIQKRKIKYTNVKEIIMSVNNDKKEIFY